MTTFSENHGSQPLSSDGIELLGLVSILWRQRSIVAVLATVGALAGVALSVSSTKYVAEGMFMAEIPIQAYKRYESVLFNGSKLRQFLQQGGKDTDPTGKKLLELLDEKGSLAKAILPSFGFTEKDAKSFGVKLDQPGELMGIRLRYEDGVPNGAAPVLLLAEFARDSIVRVDMEKIMLDQCMYHRNREQTLRNEQIQSEFEIGQEESRANTLQDLIARRVESAGSDTRQIVAVEKGTERYLSPLAQLTAVEILISDMKLDSAVRERDRTASAIKRDYYCEAGELLQGAINGRSFLMELARIQEVAFRGKDRSAGIIEQTWNELDVERENWINTYLVGMRFVALTEGAEIRERKPELVAGLALGLVMGGLLGVLSALIVGWWKTNRHAIVGPGGG